MNRFRYGLIPLMIAASFGSANAWADPDDRRVYIAPMGSYTLADDARGTDNGYGGTVAVGKRLTRGLELELLGNFTQFDTKKSEFSTPQPSSMRVWGGGAGANVYLVAQLYRTGVGLATNAVVISTGASIFTLSAVLLLLGR